MIDVETFLTTLYGLVDEYDKAHRPPSDWLTSSGPAPSLSRSEVVTLAIFAQWARFGSARAFYRYATRHLRAAFPRWPVRSPCNRLVRRAQNRLVAVGQWVANELCAQPHPDAVLASTAVVTRTAKRRGDGWLVGQADRGWSNRRGWYEGRHRLTAVTPAGVLTGYGGAPASTAEQRLAETLLAARRCPQPRRPAVGHTLGGDSYLADTHLEGKRWGPHWRQDYGAVVLGPPKRHPPFPQPFPRRLRRQFAGRREIVETV